MKLHITIDGRTHGLGPGVAIGSVLDLSGASERWFGAEPARESPLRLGDFVGRIAEGSSVNVSTITLAPHCNGTHTESARHIDDEAPTVDQVLPPDPCVALLVSVEPTGDSGAVISDECLAAALAPWPLDSVSALVIRTGWRPPAPPPFLEPAAAARIRTCGVRHLLVDLPSVDPLEDGGRLSAHRAFWGAPPRTRETRTLTELVRVPAALPRGLYVLWLAAPRWTTDAVPSTPVLYPLLDSD